MITPAAYTEKKERLVTRLRSLPANAPVALSKPSTNLFRSRLQARDTVRIDVRDFNRVISIDTRNRTADVEGMTTYEDCVNETLAYGLMPAVVPELKSITVGGAISGVGIEATSFRWGLVHETALELEVLLAGGEVAVCTPDNEHRDLFFGFANSYGTLGYALRCKIKLIPVKPYVCVEHARYSDAAAYFEALAQACRGGEHDFVDGTIFSSKEMYIHTARFTDAAPFTSDYTYMDIYYRSFATKKIDYLTARDYIWRWDTDWFWCSKNVGMEHRWLRRLAGRGRLNSKFYNRLRHFNSRYKIGQRLRSFKPRKFRQACEAVIQDVAVPIENAERFLDFFQKEIGISPVWNCPVQACDPNAQFSLYPMDVHKLYVNFGFWDFVPSDKEPGWHNRRIEQTVMALGGKKSLYSDSYYDTATFWRLYNQPAYDSLKAKYDPQGKFLNLYDKCVRRL